MSYVSGFVIPVPNNRKEDYRKMAAEAAEMFKGYGVTEIVEAWGTDVPKGKVTDFRRAVKAEDDETVVFAWMVWPDKKTCDEAQQKMEQDEKMKPPEDAPFSAKRMIFGGFTPIFEMGR